MGQRHVKTLIVGAGISGLTAAQALGGDYLVVEREREAGGYCRTIRQDGFVWDYAGHFFHFRTDELRKRFLAEIPPEDVIYQEKRTKILYRGRLIDYPFQANIHQLDKDEFIDCLYDLFQREQKPAYDSFLDMLYGKFGKSIVEKFLRPYNEKLYACDLRTLDQDAMGRFFPYADIPEIIANMKRACDASYNSSFLYPRNGAGSFIDALAARLDPARLLFGRTLERVQLAERTATLDGGEAISYDVLINTAPLNHVLPLFGRPELTALRDRLSYNKVLVFNLGFAKKSAFREHWIYVPERDANYYRIGFYDNILNTDRLSMYVEIGFPKDAAVDVPRQLELTLENLKRHGIVGEDNPLVSHAAILMDPAYVHVSTGAEREIARLKERLRADGVYTIGRYGGWTYCSMEDCMLEAQALAARLREEG